MTAGYGGADIIKNCSKDPNKAGDIVELFSFLKKKFKQIDTPINIDVGKLGVVNVSRELQGMIDIKNIIRDTKISKIKIKFGAGSAGNRGVANRGNLFENTFARAMLSAYFFSKEGNFDFKYLKSIKQFPSKQLFKKMGITTNDSNELLKNYIKSQEYINERAPLILLKTHSSMFNINNYKFTDLNNSLGVIYIVRDPRNIVTSFSNHYNLIHQKRY